MLLLLLSLPLVLLSLMLVLLLMVGGRVVCSSTSAAWVLASWPWLMLVLVVLVPWLA